MAFRRFVLSSAAEIAPDMRHPTISWTVRELLDHLDRAMPYVAIASLASDRAPAATLAANVAHAVAGRYLAGGRRGLAESSGPTGPAASVPLEWLAAWQQLLDRATWPGDDVWTIGDFWFDELLVEARTELPPERCRDFERRWEQAAAAMVRPKLTVLLAEPTMTRTIRGAALVERFERPGIGPTLRLAGVDLSGATVELLAAIEAMRP
jgi:hypothetical protein